MRWRKGSALVVAALVAARLVASLLVAVRAAGRLVLLALLALIATTRRAALLALAGAGGLVLLLALPATLLTRLRRTRRLVLLTAGTATLRLIAAHVSLQLRWLGATRSYASQNACRGTEQLRDLGCGVLDNFTISPFVVEASKFEDQFGFRWRRLCRTSIEGRDFCSAHNFGGTNTPVVRR